MYSTPLCPPRSLTRHVGRALADYGMIRPDDRVLLALSGGKDSLSLLHILHHLQIKAPVAFSLAAATVDPGIEGYDPRFLADYVQALGIPYYYESQGIVERAKRGMRGSSFCAYCARMRRGILYAVARRQGYNVLALAQHLDDLAETFLMSAFHGGRLRTMRAHYVNDAGDVRVIRPLVYARERQLAAFAQTAGLPAIRDNCPACFRVPTERARIKEVLAAQEREHPRLFGSLLATLRPLMGESEVNASSQPHQTKIKQDGYHTISH